MIDLQSCPRFGRELPDDAPRGLCPARLFGLAWQFRPIPPHGTRGRTSIDNPGAAGDAAADPHLAQARPGTIGGETVAFDAPGESARPPPGVRQGSRARL